MEKIYLSVGSLFFAALSITSCKSDDTVVNVKQEEKPTLVGSWYLYATDGNKADECGNKNSFVFEANQTGKGEIYYFDFDENKCILGQEGTFKYNVEGNTLNFIHDDKVNPAEITELTKDYFTIVQTYEGIGEVKTTWKRK